MRIIVKSLAALALLTAAGAAQAHCPPSANPPTNDPNFAGCALAAGFDKENQGKYLALLAGRLTPEEATLLAGTIDPALYGGLPDSADPEEVRRQQERGMMEDAAALTLVRKASSPGDLLILKVSR